MLQEIILDEFLNLPPKHETSLLLIKEKGCPFCEVAETLIKLNLEKWKTQGINFYSLSIDEFPSVPVKLGLVEVPALLRIDKMGKKRLRVGVGKTKDYLSFIEKD